MKKIILVLIALIALYTLVRNNLGMLPGQVMWISHPDIFYKVFLPSLMLISALVAIIKKDKINYFYLSFVTVIFDAVDRFSVFINQYYEYFTYDQPPILNSPNAIVMKFNYVPSHIMLSVEIVMVFFVIKFIIKYSRLSFATDS